jgi:hypothetical protein
MHLNSVDIDFGICCGINLLIKDMCMLDMILLLIVDIVLYRMPPRAARGRSHARRGHGGHNSHVEESDAEVE